MASSGHGVWEWSVVSRALDQEENTDLRETQPGTFNKKISKLSRTWPGEQLLSVPKSEALLAGSDIHFWLKAQRVLQPGLGNNLPRRRAAPMQLSS